MLYSQIFYKSNGVLKNSLFKKKYYYYHYLFSGVLSPVKNFKAPVKSKTTVPVTSAFDSKEASSFWF